MLKGAITITITITIDLFIKNLEVRYTRADGS